MNPLVYKVGTKLLGVHQWVYDVTDGRIGRSIGGRPMLLLRHVGAKTGKHRTSALLYVPYEKSYAVIASKGGDPKHPGWYHNLVANPDVEVQVGRDKVAVRARVAEGDEREKLWTQADTINEGQYAQYQSLTDRKIPVVVLDPR
ncbi:MAG: nitroreductase family deazaflavin-dependent oxidoreductase [Actinobacteria bacterium]|nr:nitroreductase family deazaflavin-dependent oxidoreductase [Actinomycetota bacterium]